MRCDRSNTQQVYDQRRQRQGTHAGDVLRAGQGRSARECLWLPRSQDGRHRRHAQLQHSAAVRRNGKGDRLTWREREHILGVLDQVGGNRRSAIAILGISERALRYKLKAYREQSGSPSADTVGTDCEPDGAESSIDIPAGSTAMNDAGGAYPQHI